MTPKDKAEELVDKFMDYTEHRFNKHNNLSNVYTAKQCALIMSEECLRICSYEDVEYWLQVRQETEKL